MQTGRWFGRLAGVGATLLTLPLSARAEERRPECEGKHSLFDPVADGCLETIDTDRPHQTDTPHVVPAGYAQFESAIVSAQLGGALDARSGGKASRLVFLENNYKFGLVTGVDLQLLFKHVEYVPHEKSFAAPGPFNLRVKLNVLEEDGAVPAVTLVPTVFIPLERGRHVRGGLLVFWGWELPFDFELEMNAGVLLGRAPKPAIAPVLATAVTHAVAGKLKGFVDVYATGRDVALGTGLLYPLSRDAQIDAGTYIGVSGEEPVVTPFVGFSFRH